MSQLNKVILQANGLYTYSNPFSDETVPPGSLAVANNIVIDKDGLMTPRRGFEEVLPAGSGMNTSHTEYKGVVIGHANEDSTLRAYEGINNENTPAVAWSISADKPSSAVSMKFAQAAKNLYFTSSLGVQKLDSVVTTPTVYDAGIPPAVGFETQFVPGGTAIPPQSAALFSVRANYRVVWGRKDLNMNLLLGAPSAQQEVVNSTALGQDVQFKIYIPKKISTVDYFVRVYRTLTVDSADSSPILAGDNMRLCVEVPLTASMLAAGFVDFTECIDITPDSLLSGAELYTNATQEGIAQANYQPPQCTDLAFYQNHMFYGNTEQPYSFSFTLLSAGGSYGIATGDTINLVNGATTIPYEADLALLQPFDLTTTPKKFRISTDPNPFVAVEETARNFVALVNADQSVDAEAFYALYDVGPNDPPGRIRVVETDFGAASAFTVSVEYTGFVTPGDTSGRITTTFNPTLAHDTAYSSENEAFTNRVYYSKLQEPEAVPLLNFFDIGSTDEVIQRLITTKNQLVIMTDRSIWTITGSDVNSFSPTLLDNTTRLLAPDSAVSLSNQVYALFDQGVGRISSRTVEIVSRPIEGELLRIRGETGDDTVTNFTFGVAYESDRKYILFLRTEATGDEEANLAYVFNTASITWTTYEKSASHGFVTSDDKLVLSSGSRVIRERKNFNQLDITDEDFTLDTTGMTINGPLILTNTTSLNAAWPQVGDLVSRLGYVNNRSFNPTNIVDESLGQISLVNHGLSLDDPVRFTTAPTGALPAPLVPYTTYYAIPVDPDIVAFAATPGGSFIPFTDSGTGRSKAHYVEGENFIYTKVSDVSLQTFGTLQYVITTSEDIDLKLSFDFPVISGRRSIPIEIEYNPITGEQPGILKQWSEALIITRESFETFKLAFRSGNSLNYETVDFVGSNNGAWGSFPWGSVPWGTSGAILRYRTYVPKDKQRDSFIVLRIRQATAANLFELAGVQLLYRNISGRLIR